MAFASASDRGAADAFGVSQLQAAIGGVSDGMRAAPGQHNIY